MSDKPDGEIRIHREDDGGRWYWSLTIKDSIFHAPSGTARTRKGAIRTAKRTWKHHNPQRTDIEIISVYKPQSDTTL